MMEMVKSLLEENGYPTEGLTEETLSLIHI